MSNESFEEYDEFTWSWFGDYKESTFKGEVEYALLKLEQLYQGSECASIIENDELESIEFVAPEYTPFELPDLKKKRRK